MKVKSGENRNWTPVLKKEALAPGGMAVDNDRAPVYFHVLFNFQSENIESPRELNPSTTINDLSCKKEHQQSCCLEVIVVG